jgi:hypothetical protein
LFKIGTTIWRNGKKEIVRYAWANLCLPLTLHSVSRTTKKSCGKSKTCRYVCILIFFVVDSMEHRRAAAKAAASKVPKLEMSRDQLEALTKVNRERVELDRMRKMGLKTKNSLGVRYDEQ